MGEFKNFELFDVLLNAREYYAAAEAASYAPKKQKISLLMEVTEASLNMGDFLAAEYAVRKSGRDFLMEEELERCINVLVKNGENDNAEKAIKKLPPKKRKIYREIFSKILRK